MKKKRKVMTFEEAERLGIGGYLGHINSDHPDSIFNQPIVMEGLYQAKVRDPANRSKQEADAAQPQSCSLRGKVETFYPYEKGSPPPRSRKFVVGCFWSWGPGSDRKLLHHGQRNAS